jgi:hypothetical protein
MRPMRSAVLVVLLALAPTASAQDTPPVGAAPTPEAPAEGTPAEGEAAGPSPAEEEEARTRFRQGLVLARGGDCSAALAELEASYRLVPRPNTLFNMAQCEERLHRYDLAIEQYERYLEIAPADAEDRDTVLATLESLRGLLGTIHVEVNTAAEVWLGDRIVGTAPGDVLVPGGRHALELRAAGYLPERREVEVAARQRLELSVTLTTAETHIENTTIESTTIEETHVTVERPPVPLAVFVTGAVLTGLAGIGGVVAGGVALSEHDRIAAMDPRLPRDGSSVRDAALAADVLYGTAGALAIGTLVLAFLTDFGGEPVPEESSSRTAVRLELVPVVSETTVGVVVGGAL